MYPVSFSCSNASDRTAGDKTASRECGRGLWYSPGRPCEERAPNFRMDPMALRATAHPNVGLARNAPRCSKGGIR